MADRLREAKQTAENENKDLLIEFTGSDWCPPCKQLYANVISNDIFKQQAPEHFTLLLLDNPRDKSHQSEEEQAQYRRLAAEYQVRGVPTILLCDTEGVPYASMVGYGGTAAQAYVDNLKELTQVRVVRDENFAAADKASGAERAQLLAAGLAKIDDALCMTIYKEKVDEIMSLDPQNEAGASGRFVVMAKKKDVEAAIAAIRRDAQTAGPEATVTKLDELAGEYTAEGEEELRQMILFAKADSLFAVDKEKSKAALLEAQAVAPESQIGRQISTILERFFGNE
ncbi:MAG: thioredoxin family protein [Pirellulaceae bacterium]